jgi:hypothetical protein
MIYISNQKWFIFDHIFLQKKNLIIYIHATRNDKKKVDPYEKVSQG